MTTNKKTTSKSTQSPAPATKSPAKAPAKKKAAAPKAAAPAPVAPAPAPAPVAAAPVSAPVALAPAPAPVAPAPVAAPKPVVSKPVTTTIVAQIDIGFGNALYLRGEGPGLSWDSGVLLDCVAADRWQIVLPESARPYVFKFLVNDLTWSAGPDYTVEPGSSVTLVPQFE